MIPLNPIIAAAVADMAVGMFCYSDYAFGPLWKKIHGKTNVEKDLYVRLAVQAVSSLVIATALYIAIMIFQKSQCTYGQEMLTKWFSWFLTEKEQNTELVSAMKTTGFIWLGLFVPSYLSCAAWTSAPAWIKFAIKSTCKLAQLLAMTVVLIKFA